MIQLTDVRVFLEVVRAGSFTTAARALSLPKSSVARQIARLEDELGASLIARTTRSLEMTEDGRTFLPHARRLLDNGVEASCAVGNSAAPASGQLTITASSTFGRYFLAPYLSKFRRKFPGIRVTLKLLARKEPIGLEADIAIRLGPIVDPNLGVRKLGQINFALVAAPAYLKGRSPARSPMDLANHEIVELRPPLRDNQLELSKDNRSEVVRFVPGFDIDDPDTAKAVCLAGGGIAPIPTFLIVEEIKRRELVEVLPEWKLAPALVSIVYATETASSPRIRAYLDFIQETVGGQRPWEVSPPNYVFQQFNSS